METFCKVFKTPFEIGPGGIPRALCGNTFWKSSTENVFGHGCGAFVQGTVPPSLLQGIAPTEDHETIPSLVFNPIAMQEKRESALLPVFRKTRRMVFESVITPG